MLTTVKFRPCIDLHHGKVKQIVGSTLKKNEALQVNFETNTSPSYFASLYKQDKLKGGHIIKLGPGNDQAAAEALGAFPGGLQIGGCITADNARQWLDKGASHVIVTSAIFSQGKLLMDKLLELVGICGKEHLVIDLSCRKKGRDYVVMTDGWSRYSEEKVTPKLFDKLADYCDEFLIHGVEVEGKQIGVDKDLIEILCLGPGHPLVYAGGIRSLADIEYLKEKSHSKLDFTIGSSLDIFGGPLKYRQIVKDFG